MHYNAIIVGESFAGLAAAIYLGRARRSVCVIDTRQPRNRFAKESHRCRRQDGPVPRRLALAAVSQKRQTYVGKRPFPVQSFATHVWLSQYREFCSESASRFQMSGEPPALRLWTMRIRRARQRPPTRVG